MENQIVKIEKVASKGKKYIVTVDINDEEYKFSENQIVENRIIKGAIFTLEEWDQIVKGQNKSILFDQMLHFIDYKLRTEKEVVEKLISKKATEEEIKVVIERLKSIGYIDDERYTTLFIQDSIRDYKGPYLIKFTLEQKGVDSSLINDALSNYPNEVFEENALELAKRYQKSVLNHPVNKQKELIMQKLARNGFNMDIINRVGRQLEFDNDDLDKLCEEYDKVYSKTNDQNKTITSLLQKGYRYEDIKKVKSRK